jgi:hypothetical protein
MERYGEGITIYEGTAIYTIYPMLTINEFNTGDQTRKIWYKNKTTGRIEYIGTIDELEPGYESLKTADGKLLPYEEDTFFSELDDPYGMRGSVRSVGGGRKNKSKKNKSKKYKSKKNKSKKYKSKKNKSKKYKSKKYKSKKYK